MMYNPDFKVVEFDHFKSEAGLHTFTLSAKEWIERTNALGIYVQAGRYGGTYAHKDIAFEFGSAISPVFKLYLLKEYQRLKEEENDRLKFERNAKRFLSKSNYIIHTDAVKNYVLPMRNYKKDGEWMAYADEADLLNAELIKQGYSKEERFELLQQIAQYQLKVLAEAEQIKKLPEKTDGRSLSND